MGRHRREGFLHLERIGHVAGQAEGTGAAAPGHGRRRLAIEVEHGQIGTLGGEGAGGGGADRAGPAGDHHHRAGQGLLGGLAELGLLQAPVLHVEGVVLPHRLEAADALGGQQGGGPGFGDVGGHGGLSGGLADSHQTQSRDRHHPGQGIEGLLDAPNPVVLAHEGGLIVGGVGLQGRRQGGAPGLQGGRVAGGGGDGEHQGMGLGADHVIWRGHTAARPVGQAAVVDHGTGQGCGAQIQEPVGASAGGTGGPAQGTAQARQ